MYSVTHCGESYALHDAPRRFRQYRLLEQPYENQMLWPRPVMLLQICARLHGKEAFQPQLSLSL